MSNAHLSSKGTLRHYFKATKPHKLFVILAILGLVVACTADIVAPFVLKRFIDAYELTDAERIVEQMKAFYLLLTALGIGWVGWRVATFSIIHFQTAVMMDLRLIGFKYLMRHSTQYFADNFAGSIAKWLNRFADAFNGITSYVFYDLFTLAVRFFATLLFLAFIEPQLALILFVWSVFFVGVIYRVTIFKLKYDVKSTEADSAATGSLIDAITNQRAIKQFTAHQKEFERYEEKVEVQRSWQRWCWNLSGIIDAVEGGLAAVLELGFFYFVMQQPDMTAGQFALLQGFIIMILHRIWDIARIIKEIYRSLANASEMTVAMAQPHQITDKPNAKALNVCLGAIEINDLHFAYKSGKPVFEGLNLSIKPGERVGLVGPSGSGKTTLAAVIQRLYDVQGGSIKVDGQDIATVLVDSLRKEISIVPQMPDLFHRSLMENIRLGNPDASDKEVIRAAKLAQCHEFIMETAEGYKTLVGERGIKLSGGQRQRIAIARAILKHVKILVLDEATSALDSRTEKLIQKALDALMQDRTTIVIAHRFSTVMGLDRIIVMDEGKIVQQGTHAQLSVVPGLYKTLLDHQKNGMIPEDLPEATAIEI